MEYKQYFSGKKITVMGLGLLGGALNDTIFLAECEADLTVTDLKTAEQLKPSLDKLRNYSNIKFTLGEHKLEDFQNSDMILQPGNVPIDSPYLAEAKKNNIPIFVSESLFAKHVDPKAVLVGITGTRGKTTVTRMIYEILSADLEQNISTGTVDRAIFPNRKVVLGGNIQNVSTLSLLNKIKPGDIVVMELDSWALHGMGDIKKSPHVAVFTTFFDDHLNYYRGTSIEESRNIYLDDKANIFKYQKSGDTLILGSQCADLVRQKYDDIKSKIVISNTSDLSIEINLKILGEHNRYNAACAMHAALALDVPMDVIKNVLGNFKGVPGRLELLRKINGVNIYNDTTATTPEATIAALRALYPSTGSEQNQNIILILGGADKGLDMTKLEEAIPNYCKAVVLLAGTGTDKLIINNHQLRIEKAESLSEAVKKATEYAQSGDTILFSPAFASFGMFKNEYDRGDQFNSIVSNL